jgi:hypothetical protein
MTYDVELDHPAQWAFDRVPWPTSESVARAINHFAAEHAVGARARYSTIRGGGHWIRVHVNHLDRRVLVLWIERAR